MACVIFVRNGYNNNPPNGGVKGDIVDIIDNHNGIFSEKELLNYAVVKITDTSRSEIVDYIRSYVTRLNYSVHDNDLSLDEWTIDIFSENVNLAGQGKLNYLDIKNWMDDASISVVGSNDNGARVRFKVRNVIGSDWFWFSKKTGNEILSEEDYDQTTGRHDGKIELPYSQKAVDFVTKILTARGATDQVNDLVDGNLVVTFSITSQQLFTDLKNHIQNAFQFPIKSQRWRVSNSDVDSLETYYTNNGVPFEMTKTQLIAKLLDKELE
jgi:hypothetical protein